MFITYLSGGRPGERSHSPISARQSLPVGPVESSGVRVTFPSKVSVELWTRRRSRHRLNWVIKTKSLLPLFPDFGTDGPGSALTGLGVWSSRKMDESLTTGKRGSRNCAGCGLATHLPFFLKAQAAKHPLVIASDAFVLRPNQVAFYQARGF